MLFALLLSAASAGKAKKYDFEATSKGQPTYECPASFKLQGKKCVRHKEDVLHPTCPSGSRLQGDQCMLTVAPTEVCEDGYIYDGLICMKYDTIGPVTECALGFSLVTGKKHDVYCEKMVKIPGPEVCPQGTIDDGKKCVNYSYVSPDWTCPPGAEKDGHFCSSYNYYDCSDPIFPSGKKHLRMLKPKKNDVVIELGKGSQTEIVEVSRECKKTNYTPAVAVCPPGTLQDGKQCKMTQVFDRHPTNEIITFEEDEASTRCPVGYSWCPDSKKAFGGKKEDNCCKFFEQQVYWECPMGYQLNGHECQAWKPADYVCMKDGYKKSKKSNTCSQTEYREPVITYKVEYSCHGKDCGNGHK